MFAHDGILPHGARARMEFIMAIINADASVAAPFGHRDLLLGNQYLSHSYVRMFTHMPGVRILIFL